MYKTHIKVYLRNSLSMITRASKLIEARPDIPSAKLLPNMSTNEHFQNKVLRPIIKFQNNLFIEVFKNYIRKNKNRFYELNVKNRLLFIEHALQKDIKFRNSIKGMILGQFTVSEYAEYIQDSSALNKRMINLVIKRIQDQVQLLEPNYSYQQAH